jgi:hypothetical protein
VGKNRRLKEDEGPGIVTGRIHIGIVTESKRNVTYHHPRGLGIWDFLFFYIDEFGIFLLLGPFNNPFPSPPLRLIFIFPKKYQLKTFLTFFTFYITSTIFYYYLNKKINYKTKNIYFSI